MGLINLLDKEVYNKIAAGEVVERPASVVKELIENSIDAGASKIEIRIKNGGNDIEVIDDGSGILREDVQYAFLPHATSKITIFEDLNDISSLGFRGEALASISAVSEITLKTRTNDEDYGICAEIINGKIESSTDVGMNVGTEIAVNNLFYNTPARLKFLKKPQTEVNEIGNIVARFILGNPNIKFIYEVDGKCVYNFDGKGLASGINTIYGADALKNCFYIEKNKNGICLSGYIGKHGFVKANRTYQTLIMNGRYIINSTVSTAIHNAYSSYLLKRTYPFYVLQIYMPIDKVDVNVHPNKMDVRFSDNNLVFGTIYNMIASVLDGTDEALKIVKQNPAENNTSLFNNEEFKKSYLTNENPENLAKSEEEKNYNVENIEEKGINSQYFNYPGAKCGERVDNSNLISKIVSEGNLSLEEYEKMPLNFNVPHKTEELSKLSESDIKLSDSIDFLSLKIIGTLFETYVLCSLNDSFYLIDQHASHERIIYDNLRKKQIKKEITVQDLLVPYVFNLNSLEYDFLKNNLVSFSEIGFIIEDFGYQTVKVVGVPSELSSLDVSKFFNQMFKDIGAFNKIDSNALLEDKLMKEACTLAVKAGDKLSLSEIKLLLKYLNENNSLRCPHGRPIIVEITKKEIEKWFRRIV